MKDKFQITHEFLLLFLNLAQLKDKKQIIELFINAMDKQYIGLEIIYLEGDQCERSQCIPIKTQDNSFGFFCVKGQLKTVGTEFMAVIRNLIKMLAVILENLKREKLLQEELQWKSKVFESAITANSIADDKGNIKYVNDAFLKMWGCKSKQEVLDKSIAQYIESEEKSKEIINALNENSIWEGQYKALKSDGTTFDAYGYATVLNNKQGKVVGYQSSVIDISERLKIEAKIKENEEKLRNILENSTNMFYSHDDEHNLTYLSPQVKDMFGYSQEEAKVKWTNLVTDNPINKIGFEHTVRAIETGKSQPPYELEMVHKSGEKVWVEIREGPVIVDGKTVAIVGALTNITERKQMESRLLLNAAILKNTTEAVCLVRMDTIKIVYANIAFEQMFGYEHGEMIGKYASIINDPQVKDSIEKSKEIIDEINKTGGWRGEVQNIRKNGQRFISDVNVSLFEHEDYGKVIVAAHRDITKQKQIKLELAESLERFKALHNASFGGIAIHDQGVILECNQGLSEMTGYSLGELIGMNGLLLIAPEYREMIMNNITTGYKKPYEANGLRKNGEKFPMRLEARNIPYKGKKVRTVEFRDITEQKKAQEQIENLAKFPEENPSPVMRLLNNGKLIYVNEGAKEFLDVWNCKDGICKDREILDALNDAFTSRQIKTIEVKALDKIFSMKITPVENKEYVNIYGLDITDLKLLEQALEKRVVAMTQPLDEAENVDFDVLFDIKEIQKLQDLFAKSANVASIITDPNGIPITEPSSFCRLCSSIIRKTEKGLKNCYCSDGEMGRHNPDGPIIQSCLSGGLWDAGASISVGGKHIANWLIGQVRNETQSEEKMEGYAHEIGADPKEFIKAFREVPKMSEAQFKNVANALFVMANLLSASAYQNIQQARFIDGRKKAEAGLLESNKRFQELFDNMSSAVAIYNSVDDGNDFVFKDFNKSGEKIENISKLDIIGERVTKVFPGIKEFGLLDVFKRVFQTGKPEKFPAKIYRDERVVGWRDNYIYKLPEGELIAIYDDVTEQKKIEEQEKEIFAANAAAQVEKNKARELSLAYEELKRTQDQLLQVEKLASIGQLGAGVAHELNSPLAGVLSLLRSYKKEKDSNTEEYEDLQEMEKACEHMSAIIKGLNAFARQSAGDLKEVDCNEAIKSALSFTVYQFEKNGIHVEIDLDDDLDKVKADENQIQQIVINMITNAADALPRQGVFKITTKNVIVDGNKYGEVRFEDNGAGIKKADLKKVFDPFFTTKRPGGGVGLGLSIVYKIIENHKGTVTVESQEGKGAVFTVRLPSI